MSAKGGGGGRPSQENNSKSKSQTSLTFANPVSSSQIRHHHVSTGTHSHNSILGESKSISIVGDHRQDDSPSLPLGRQTSSSVSNVHPNPSSSECCNQFIDDTNNSNVFLFATSKAVLNYIFETNNLCDKSEEQLKREREEDDGWGYYAGKTASAVGSAVSIAIDFLMGDSDCEEDALEEYQPHFGSSPEDENEMDDVGGASQFGSTPASTTKKGAMTTRNHPNFSTVRMVHENGEPLTNSQADLLHGHPLTHEECLVRLDRISELVKMLPDSDRTFLDEYHNVQNHTGSQTHMNHNPLDQDNHDGLNINDVVSFDDMDDHNVDGRNVNEEAPLDNLDHDHHDHRTSPNRVGEENGRSRTQLASTSSGGEVCVNPGTTLMQGLLKPYNQTSIPLSDRITGDLETGILLELVHPTARGLVSTSQDDLQGTPSEIGRVQNIGIGPTPTDQTNAGTQTQYPPPPSESSENTPRPNNTLNGSPTRENEDPIVPSKNTVQPLQTQNKTPTDDAVGGSKRNPIPAELYTQTVVINYIEEEMPYKVYLAKKLVDSNKQPTARVENKNNTDDKKDLKCVLTELDRGLNNEIETILEINGRPMNVPKHLKSKAFVLSELHKMNATGSTLKKNLEKLNSIVEKSAGNNSDRLKDLQNSYPEEITSIKIVEEEEIAFGKENSSGSGSKTVVRKNMECTLHDVHPSTSKPSMKALEVNGKFIDPEEEPVALTYFIQLEETEATLEEIGDDFQEMMNNSDSVSDMELIDILKKGGGTE